MQSHWNDSDAAEFSQSALSLRVYTSRLLGRDPQLVLHGGGNTSVKVRQTTFLGDEIDILFVKGSGGDLATIGAEGFSPVRLATALKLGTFETLSDADMVRELRAAMLNPDAPTPSIEAIVHAVIAPKFVDHTHANAVVAVTNLPNGADVVREIYGDRVIIIPYVMPGFILAKTIAQLTANADWSKLEGLILLNHGIFTFGSTAKESYERMIKLVGEAEAWLEQKGGGASAWAKAEVTIEREDLRALAAYRKSVGKARGKAVLALLDSSPEAAGFASRGDVNSLSQRGPLTPDHTIRTKRLPALLENDSSVASYVSSYEAYYEDHQNGETKLDPAPRWAVWPNKGVVSFGTNRTEAGIVSDIAAHTIRTIQQSEAAGGWTALGAKDLFEIEYWELEQAKLRKAGTPPPLQGKVAIVSGAAAGIGRAIAQALHAQGAVVFGLDLNPAITERLQGPGLEGIVVNLTQYEAVQATVEDIVRRCGGLDILVSNAGIFTAGANFEDMDPVNWAKSMEVNLTSHMRLLQFCVPYLKQGFDPTAIFVGSRNVAAPGAGAGSYSCAKAAVTQLVRVAALELAPHGVRVNIIHPDAVFDTELWTPEALQRSAERYGITVDEYKTRNLMKAEIKSADVAGMVCTMAGTAFAKTTGAQIPVDGGNDRVI
jgi:rhamnose utilization protein RhaD (predicted bifunctional aldolase and dehydrogenase)/NAD(P)-dependent dehydrogenase (short-subunit alcohol dehydrogenase family)